jgi:hypothetical protein
MFATIRNCTLLQVKTHTELWNIYQVSEEQRIRRSEDQKSRVAKEPSKTTPRLAVLGPESEIAPFVFAATIEAEGLIDTASETKLFNDEQDQARGQ